MRRFATFVALLLLLSSAAPLLACMTGQGMTHEENACCRSMHGNCGNMAKMGCCRTEVRTDERPQLATAAPTLVAHFAVVLWLAPVLSGPSTVPAARLYLPDEYSPPGLITAETTVLRI